MLLQTVFSVVLFLFVAGVEISPNGRTKRSDIDLQTCTDNFNIHRDKIIRTQDSQNMGAKYLNEIDLGSREECLRLCCETDDCDVFVFEEKNSGSCYLFHCGPPEDFKCKFTHHVNYSSGVLSVNRHLPDLESQIKLTKHEQDLTKLRKPELEPVPSVAGATLSVAVNVNVKTTPPTTTTTTATTKEVLPPMNTIRTSDEARKCSRFQFECRATGECIAIYNACDGIPQCADGSDEAPELGCPGAASLAPPPPPPPPQPADDHAAAQRYEANIQPPPYRNQLPVQNGPRSEADFLRPASDPRNINRIAYDQPPLPPQSQGVWPPRQGGQVAQQAPQYAGESFGKDKNSIIFNHKETGLQVPDGQEISQIQYGESLNRDYPKIQNYYGDSYRSGLVQQETWQPPATEERYENNGYQQPIPQNPPQEQIRKEQIIPAIVPPKILPETKQETVNPKHVQEKLAHDLKHSKDNMEHGSAEKEPKKVKIEKHIQHEEYTDVISYKMSESDLQDGISQTPKGAILSVTMGLIISFVMAVMIGCRLKMVRRRARRGKSYAHDADYLVNGMYL